MSVVSIHGYPADLFSFVEFITSFFHVLTRVLTAAWQKLMLDSDSELDFDSFVTVEFGENEHFAVALGSGSDLD